MTLLGGLRIVDLGHEHSAYCGKLLAELGADVILVEPPSGGAPRERQPLARNGFGPDDSLHFAHFNAGKRSMTLDLSRATERDRLWDLLSEVDAVVESRSAEELDSLGLDYERVRVINPALVMTSVSPYGRSGPKCRWRGTDLTAAASSGLLYITGEPDRPPTQYGQEQIVHLASLYAAIGTLAALRASAVTGQGSHVDVSMQQAAHSITGDRQLAILHLLTGQDPVRTGNQTAHFFPYRNFPCTDGWVTICALEPHQWAALAEWVFEVTGAAGVLDERYAGRGADRAPYADEIYPLLQAFALRLTKRELMERGQALGIPVMSVSTVDDLLVNPQLVARGFFQALEHPTIGAMTEPGPPYRFSGSPGVIGRRAPVLGDAGLPATGQATSRPKRRSTNESALSRSRPLAGLRVLELGWYVAGPWVGQALRRLGAEVIKLETRKRVDVMRTLPIIDGRTTGADYSSFGGGKKSITLDVRTSEGRALCLRLIAVSDVFIENFSTKAIARFGLEYDEVKAVNPRIIMARMPGLGLEGPYRDFVSYGLALQALAGLDELTGFPDGPPGGSSVSYPDYAAALHASVAILAALEHRERTGEGQLVETAQLEAAVSILGPAFLDRAAHGHPPLRIGNAHPTFAPHGVYRCSGDDAWVAVAVTCGEEWLALASAIEADEWLDDAELRHADQRRARRAALDRRIERWTAGRPASDAERALVEAGVPAAAVAKAGDLLADEQLRSLEYFAEIVHPEFGPLPFASSPIRIAGEAAGPEVAHELGADNDEVFGELLELSADELSSLRAKGVIG